METFQSDFCSQAVTNINHFLIISVSDLKLAWMSFKNLPLKLQICSCDLSELKSACMIQEKKTWSKILTVISKHNFAFKADKSLNGSRKLFTTLKEITLLFISIILINSITNPILSVNYSMTKIKHIQKTGFLGDGK